MTTKSLLLAALAPQIVEETVEGFGPARIKQVSVGENDAIRASIAANKNAPQSEFGLRLLIASVVDENGELLFSNNDIDALRAASGSKIDALIKRVLTLNGYVEDSEKKAKS